MFNRIDINSSGPIPSPVPACATEDRPTDIPSDDEMQETNIMYNDWEPAGATGEGNSDLEADLEILGYEELMGDVNPSSTTDIDFVSVNVRIQDIPRFSASVTGCCKLFRLKDPQLNLEEVLFMTSDSWLVLIHKSHKPQILKAWYRIMKSVVAISQNPQLFFAKGNLRISSLDLVRILELAGVESCRLYSYGSKSTVESMKFLDDLQPLREGSELGRLNTYDVGTITPLTTIALLKSVPGRFCCVKEIYPVLTGLAPAEVGSINIQVADVKIKVYPRLIHFIKSWASLEIPGTYKTLKSRILACKHILREVLAIGNANPYWIGGYRCEITVSCASLAAALRFAEPLIPEIFDDYGIEVVHFTIDQYIENFCDVLALADELNIFDGENQVKISSVKKAIISDIYSAIGITNQYTDQNQRDIDSMRTKWRIQLGLQTGQSDISFVTDPFSEFFVAMAMKQMKKSAIFSIGTDIWLYKAVKRHEETHPHKSVPWETYVPKITSLGGSVSGMQLRERYKNIKKAMARHCKTGITVPDF